MTSPSPPTVGEDCLEGVKAAQAAQGLFDRLLDCSFLCAVKFILLREASDGGPGKIRFIIFCKRDSFMSVLTKTERKQSWEGKNGIRPRFVCVIELALYWVSSFFSLK